MARRSKFTEETIANLEMAFHKSSTIVIACKGAGLDRGCYYRWLKQASKSKPHREFKERMEKAQALGAQRLLDIIDEAATRDWKPAAWKLERIHGYRKDNNRISYEHRPEEPIEITDGKSIIKEQLGELKQAMNRAKRSQSWQAYAALQRAYMATYEKFQAGKETNREFEELEKMTDEELIDRLSDYVDALPVVLQNKFLDRIGSINSKVINLR